MKKMAVGKSGEVPLNWRLSPQVELSPILGAALEAFHDRGYHATSVRDIARRVGVTVPALYYHHENKEAILYTLLDASIVRLHQLCVAANNEADDPKVRFCNLVECIVLYMTNCGKMAFLDAEIRSLSPKPRRKYTTKRDRIETLLRDSLEDGVKAGIFQVTSPVDTARALLGMFQAIATWYHPDGPLTPQEVAARYLDIASHATGAAIRNRPR